MKQLFAIFRNPVSHSKSPLMHHLSFQGLRFDVYYTRYLLEAGSKLKETFFTIVEKEVKLYGYNIDAPGFLKAISEFKEIKTHMKKAFIL